jgi:hypothetical protein
MRTGLALSLILGASAVLSGCAAKEEPAPPVSVTRYVAIDQPAPVPPGVVRYCWEEPIVQFERNGPGLDVEGTWYHPFYIAVREVRQGRWRPCEPVKSEVKGETKNER